MRYWDQRKDILMDKTNTNIMRVSDIKKFFDNVCFLSMVRNPYAQVEGIMRRNGANAEYAAKFALKCLRYQKQNNEKEKNILLLSYEDLCDDTKKSIKKIKDFMPLLGEIKADIEFSAHNFKTKGKMKIQNLNKEKISKITSQDLKVINAHFESEKDLLKYFGYSIIN